MDPLTIALILAGVSVLSTGANIWNQRSMLNEQQDFNSAEAEKARDWASQGEQFNRMTQLGFNPDLAAASIMGGSQSVPYAASSPNAPQVPLAFEGIQQYLQKFIGDQIAAKKAPEEIKGLSLNNLMTQMEMNWKPMLYQEQVNWYKESVANLIKDKEIKEFNRQFLEAKAPYAKALAAEEYFQALATTDKLWNEADLIFAQIQDTYADVDLKKVIKDWYRHDISRVDSQTSLNYNLGFQASTQGHLNEAQTELSIDQQGLVKAQTATEEARALGEFQSAIRTFIDNQESSGGFAFPGDMLYDSVMAEYAGEDGKFLCNTFLQAERDMYDSYIQSRWQNYGKEFWMNMGDAIPEFIRGFIPVSRQGAFNKTPKKPKVNTNVKGKPNSNSTFGGSRPVRMQYNTGSAKNAYNGYPLKNGGYTWE